jgi:hypothetical protein
MRCEYVQEGLFLIEPCLFKLRLVRSNKIATALLLQVASRSQKLHLC